MRVSYHDSKNWDKLLATNPDGGNVFQSAEMLKTKQLGGWRPRYLEIDGTYVAALEKHLPVCGKFWYLPKGPGVSDMDGLLAILPDLKSFALSEGVFAIKIEPELADIRENHQKMSAAGLVKATPIQPNASTVILNLEPSLDKILASLNQKGRHAIRRAQRDGVTTAPVELTDENMRIMYNMLVDTASGRFESSLRSYKYYQEFWSNFASSGSGQLFFAYYQGQVVAAAYAIYLGHKGLYKDGASVRDRTAYGASHLLQWEIIQWMKRHDVTSYDLCGSPHSSQILDLENPFYGIGRFKTSFSKTVTDYVGAYDLVTKPLQYAIWRRVGQRLTLSWHYRTHHENWY